MDLKLKCESCNKAGSRLLRCSRCGLVYYCNPHCQKKHWKKHKAAVGPLLTFISIITSLIPVSVLLSEGHSWQGVGDGGDQAEINILPWIEMNIVHMKNTLFRPHFCKIFTLVCGTGEYSRGRPFSLRTRCWWWTWRGRRRTGPSPSSLRQGN